MSDERVIKGGKNSEIEVLYEKMGNLKGVLDSLQGSLNDIKDNLTRLWNKFDDNQKALIKTAKEISDEHSQNCPAKIEIERFTQEKEKNMSRFRWIVTILLSCISIGIAYLSLKK